MFPLRIKTPRPPLSLEQLRKKKKKKEEWIRHRYSLASFLLRNRDETVEGRINFVRSVISFEIPFEILFHARFFFCNFVFKPSATEHFLRRPMIAMVIDREYCGGKERRKKKCMQVWVDCTIVLRSMNLSCSKKKKRKCGRRGARNLCYRMGRGDNWFQALSNDRETVMGIKRSLKQRET